MTFRLTDSQMQQFNREGYLVVDGIFSEEVLDAVAAEVTAMIDQRCAELIAAGELTRDYREYPFETRLTHISRETDKVAMSMRSPSSGPAASAYSRTYSCPAQPPVCTPTRNPA